MRFDLVQNIGKCRGHFTRKENRAAKLICMWNDLHNKMEGMVIRGNGVTLQARLAYAVLLMMETGIRVGNESSAEGFVCENKFDKERFGKQVQTYGLTTLKPEHVKCGMNRLILQFTGKKHVDQTLVVHLNDNQTLVHYCPPIIAENETWLRITDAQVRKFVKRYVGHGFSPKDIRTAKVNLLFVNRFASLHGPIYSASTTKSARKRALADCIAEVAERIGHTKGVCKSAYLSKPLLANILATESGYVYVSSLK